MFADADAGERVALRPLWPTVLSSTRFAERTRWRFANRVASFAHDEPGAPRSLTDCGAGDALQLRFDFSHWHAAFARSCATAREIVIAADDGSDVALVRLERAHPTLDELIWRMVDDDPPPAPATLIFPRAAALALHERAGATRLRDDAVARALQAAAAIDLPLRIRLSNRGGAVSWTPARARVEAAGETVILRERDASMTLRSHGAASWAVRFDAPDTCCPALECCTAGDAGSLRLDVPAMNSDTCAAWRTICTSLETDR
jgi:hypothetical protein